MQDTWGKLLAEHLVQIKSLDTEQEWTVWTYALGTVQPDDYYQENFAIGDLPEGPYELQINFAGHAFHSFIYIQPGQTNFVEFSGRQGFTMVNELASTSRSDVPPYP